MATLNKQIKKKLYSYFITSLGAMPYKHGWLKVPVCPHCGRDGGKYGINVSQNRSNCFVCGEHPTAINLVMELENFTEYKDLLNFLKNGDFHYYEYKDEEVELKEISSDLKLPEGFKLIDSHPDTKLGKTVLRYITKRGFDVEYVRRKGWGYGTSGDLFGYLILPIYNDGRLVYYNARRVIGDGPRYKNPNTDSTGVGKSFILYNRDALFMYKKIYLCEGLLNAETISREKGVSSSGKILSSYQINDIIKSPVEEVVIILDPDAKQKAIELAMELSYHKKVKVIFLPDGYDVNDLGRDVVIEKVRNTEFISYSKLLTIKNKLSINERAIHSYQ